MSLFNDLLTEIKQLPVIDVHSHVRHHQPPARSPAEVLLYHVFAVELMGAGMSSETFERLQDNPSEADFAEWVKYWRLCRGTTMGRVVWRTAQELWGVAGEPTVATLSELWQRVTEEVARDPHRATEVWDRCNLTAIAAVGPEAPETSDSRVRMVEPRLRWQLERLLWGGDAARLAMENSFAKGVTAENFEEIYAAWLSGFASRGANSIACAPPVVETIMLDEATLQGALTAVVKEQSLNSPETTALHLAQARGLLRCSHETGIPVFLTLGIQVLDAWWTLAIADHTPFLDWLVVTMKEFPKCRVLLANANWSTHQSVCLAARQCRGIYATGHWWQSLYATSTGDQIRQRLDTVPMNKVIGFFSDAYCAEWVYSRLLIAREQLALALDEQIERGHLTEEAALEVARYGLHDNAAEVLEEAG